MLNMFYFNFSFKDTCETVEQLHGGACQPSERTSDPRIWVPTEDNPHMISVLEKKKMQAEEVTELYHV